jgi:hypothetical protein
MSQAAFPSSRFAGVVDAIRGADIRYQRPAAEVRPVFRQTRRASYHARKLGLAVDIQLALACPQRDVSAVPLPVLDHSRSPTMPSRKQKIPIQTRYAANHPVTPESFLFLDPLSPFFPSSESFRWSPKTPLEQLSSRFSVSPISPMNVLSWGCDTSQYASEQIKNFRTHSYKELPEVPVPMDDAWDREMPWTPMATTPDSLTSESSPVSSDLRNYSQIVSLMAKRLFPDER